MGLVDLLDGLFHFVQVSLVLAEVGAGWHQEGQELHFPLQLGVLGEHLLVGAEAANDVLVGFSPVYADDVGFAGFCLQAGFVVEGARRFGDALHFVDVDGSGVDFHVAEMAVQLDHFGYPTHLGLGNELLHRVEEAAAVLRRLEANDVARAQGLADPAHDVAGNYAPVNGGGPGDVNVVLDYRLGQLVAHNLRQQVEVVIVAHDYRRLSAGPRFVNHHPGRRPR